jgi:hypothetical protein
MGRGLSDLQRYILRRTGEQEHLSYTEILTDCCGWEPQWSLPGAQQCDPVAIGRKRYHNTYITVSRACRRLWARGLFAWVSGTRGHWTGVAITEAGRAWLSADAEWERPRVAAGALQE